MLSHTTLFQFWSPEEYCGLDRSFSLSCFLLIWYFLIPEVGETPLDFVKFWLYQAFSRVDCLALSELGDLHKLVRD